MSRNSRTVSEQREYAVLDVTQAKSIAKVWLREMDLHKAIKFGLPEIDDRYHCWRVPLISALSDQSIGEVVIDAKTSLVLEKQSTSQDVLEARLLRRTTRRKTRTPKEREYKLSPLRNTVGLGDSEDLIQEMPAESVDLVFTSPPYYNARPQYSDYITYEEYLLKIRKVIQNAHRVLNEGRFFVMNTAPVLIRRARRSESSTRIAVPFDIHRLFTEEGYDFIDDIIWKKPEGAGWATGRGRRFAADRNPLQYKTVPVTEYVLVYRKHTDLLIDWAIRNHPDKTILQESKIPDGYETTNVWTITPTSHPVHPAVFPLELAEKVITYYSFKNDVVLDPFAGIGTVGEAAAKLGRRFVLFENNRQYIGVIRADITRWLGKKVEDVLWINCGPPERDTHRLL